MGHIYIYDTDSPWDNILASLFAAVVFASLCVLNIVFANQAYEQEGWSGFYYLMDRGTSHVFQIFMWGCWSFNFFRHTFRKWQALKMKGSE